MAAVERISFSPDPPVAGAKLTICYDFSGTDDDKATLVVTLTPRIELPNFEVSSAAPCVTIDVPLGTTWITVEDQGGPSPDASAPVQQ